MAFPAFASGLEFGAHRVHAVPRSHALNGASSGGCVPSISRPSSYLMLAAEAFNGHAKEVVSRSSSSSSSSGGGGSSNSWSCYCCYAGKASIEQKQ